MIVDTSVQQQIGFLVVFGIPVAIALVQDWRIQSKINELAATPKDGSKRVMHQPQEKNLNGIGGWLILVLIGIVISIGRIGLMLIRDHMGIFSDGSWGLLTNPFSDVYHHLWASLIIFEIIGNIAVLFLAIVALMFLLNKSKQTPKIMIAWLLVGLVFVVTDFFLAEQIPAIAAQPADMETVKEIARSVVGVLIWVPYFLVSKRVKVTFTREWPNNSFKPKPLRGSA